jgi:penicillin amidase
VRRALAGIAAVVLAALVLAAGAVLVAVRASLPDDGARSALPALSAPARAHLDSRGRPFTVSATLADAMVLQGWFHARDRLWQMELLRRAGRARLAEALGPAFLAEDERLLRGGVPALARRLETAAGARTLALVDAYVAGVNARLEAAPERPPEFLLLGLALPRWRRGDVFAVGALLAWDSSRNLDNELLRARIGAASGPGRAAAFRAETASAPDFPFVVAEAGQGPLRRPDLSLGSSAFAVAPRRSASGHALFAFDSHDAWSMPSLLYEVHHFFGPADADGVPVHQLRGWSAPGLPGVVNGFNEFVAWGLTNVGDSQDAFLETRDPRNPHRFLGRDGWYDAEVRTETLAVAGRDPETVEVVVTENGPLVSVDPPISLAWTGHRLGGRGLDALFALAEARDDAALAAALDAFAAPVANVTWATVDGRIGSRVVGVLPVRGRGDGLVPQDATDPDSAWRGTVPAAALPRRVDPPRGWVAAANARTGPPGRAPLVSADNAPGYRLRRIVEVLEARTDHDVEGFRALQTDFTDVQARRLLPVLLPLVDPDGLTADGRTALAILRDWSADPVRDAGATGALLFSQWYVELARALLVPVLGETLARDALAASYPLNHALDVAILPDGASPWWDGDRPGRVTAAFSAAVAALGERLGGTPADWRWDDLHRLHFPHALGAAAAPLDALLSRGPWPWGGGNVTPGRARWRYDDPFEARGGASVRVVVELARPPAAAAVIPGGQSGHFLSRHYDDQFPDWLAGELETLPAAPPGRPTHHFGAGAGD